MIIFLEKSWKTRNIAFVGVIYARPRLERTNTHSTWIINDTLACKHHLGARDVLLGVGEVLIQGVVAPGDALVLVGLGVREASGLTCLAANQTPEVRSCNTKYYCPVSLLLILSLIHI